MAQPLYSLSGFKCWENTSLKVFTKPQKKSCFGVNVGLAVLPIPISIEATIWQHWNIFCEGAGKECQPISPNWSLKINIRDSWYSKNYMKIILTEWAIFF